MDVKASKFRLAMDQLRDRIHGEAWKTAVLEISVREDNPGEGELCECLVVKCTVVEPPGKYDDVKTSTTNEWTVEVFADHENRPPRLTLNQTRDLEGRD